MTAALALLLALVAQPQDANRSGSTPAEDVEGWARYDKVKMTVNSEQLRGCKHLGLVHADPWVPSDPLGRGHDLDRMEIRWTAAQMGGNAVLLTKSGAEAYRCKERTPTPTRTPRPKKKA